MILKDLMSRASEIWFVLTPQKSSPFWLKTSNITMTGTDQLILQQFHEWTSQLLKMLHRNLDICSWQGNAQDNCSRYIKVRFHQHSYQRMCLQLLKTSPNLFPFHLHLIKISWQQCGDHFTLQWAVSIKDHFWLTKCSKATRI